MTNLSISLPEALIAYLQEQLASGQYNTADDYIQDLIQQDKAHNDVAKYAETPSSEMSPQQYRQAGTRISHHSCRIPLNSAILPSPG